MTEAPERKITRRLCWIQYKRLLPLLLLFLTKMDPGGAESSPNGSYTTQRKRRWTQRSRAGCLTCRARRKRCDMARPLCNNCNKACKASAKSSHDLQQRGTLITC